MDRDSIDSLIREHMGARRMVDNFPLGQGQWVGVMGSRNALPGLFVKLGYTSGVEIGVQRARFTVRFCQEMPGLKMYCVDPWSSFGRRGQSRHDQNYQITCDKLAQYNAYIMRMSSLEAVKSFADRSLDFAFIDGNHTFDYVVQDIIQWAAKVRAGGMICCHDYSHFYEVGVVQAVDAYTFCHHIYPKYINFEPSPTAFWINP